MFGFLIGGIINGAVEGHHFSFANSYARRARRIMSALLVMLAISIVIFHRNMLWPGYAVLLPVRGARLRT